MLVALVAIGIMALYHIFTLFPTLFLEKCYNFPLTCFISGIKNVKYSSLDHFSIIPYFTIICVGILIGKVLYKHGNKRTFVSNKGDQTIDNLKNYFITKVLSIIGKNSLLIYFIHFILFYAIFYLYKSQYNLNTVL